VSRPVVLAVAHGSRDPAAGERVAALARRAAPLAAGAEIVVAFVQHGRPSLADALARAVAGVGAERVVVVPLLLSTGYHLTHDIAGAAAAAGAAVTGPLGPDPRLTAALAGQLTRAGAPPGTPVVLAAAGSSDPAAASQARMQAALLGAHLGVPVIAGFASAASPTVAQAVAALSARTGRPVAVGSYLLAPGEFQDRLRDSGARWVSDPLGDHPAVAALLVERLRAHWPHLARPAVPAAA
jgi:sirohydrochlorin ferrochelatase